MNRRCLDVNQESLPLDHGTIHFGAEAVGLEPTSGYHPPPVFKTGSSSGRMTSIELRGLESNQRPPGSEPGVTTSSNCPGSFMCLRHARNRRVRSKVPGAGIEPANSWFKARHHYQQRRPRNAAIQSALRESNPPRQLGRLAPLPLGQGHASFQLRRKELNLHRLA